ncbi:MAG: hypothetical protein ABIK89_00625 [Planctomycetota bacterium]
MQPAVPPTDAPSRPGQPEVPFGSNAVRLSPGECVIALGLTCVLMYLIPALWERIDQFQPGPDYRLPYRLSNDYWMAARHFRRAASSSEQPTLVLGDSVVWGHYVAPRATLSHYLGELGGGRFANLGVDGIHPAALAGLVEHHGRDISTRDVVLNCNLLWMSSKRHDLQVTKEFSFNHPTLVPQFFPRIPCYRETLSGRIGIVVGRKVPFFGWASHLEIAYFENTDLPMWTIDHPYANPAASVTLKLPSPEEPPSPEPVAEPWTTKGLARFNPSWVELETSFQWASFKKTVEILRRRGNRVFVLVGPFNEHMLTEESLAVYAERKREAEAWLQANDVPYAIPTALPSDLYADASHPLAEGYSLLAERLLEHEAFVRFLNGRSPKGR